MKNKKVPTQYRQGDVLFVRTNDSVPEKIEGFPLHNSKSKIVALGEVTGHKHRVEGPADVYYTRDKDRGEFINVHEDTKVDDAVAKVVHEEHAAITLPPGRYKIVHQREYDGQSSVDVLD